MKKAKKPIKRKMSLLIVCGVMVAFATFAVLMMIDYLEDQKIKSLGFPYTIVLDTLQYVDVIDESYSVKSSNPSIIEGKIDGDAENDYYELMIIFHKPGEGSVKLENGEKSVLFKLSIDENKKYTIRPF